MIDRLVYSVTNGYESVEFIVNWYKVHPRHQNEPDNERLQRADDYDDDDDANTADDDAQGSCKFEGALAYYVMATLHKFNYSYTCSFLLSFNNTL